MKKVLSLLLVASIAGTGCIKKKDVDFKNLTIDNWQPDWALPILNSTLTLKNIVKTSTIVSEDAQGLYSLHYVGDLFTARASDYIKIPNQSYTMPSFTLSTPITVGSYTGTVSDSHSGAFAYTDASGSQLNTIVAKGGTLTFTLNSTFRHNVTATITFPRITKAGSPLQVTTTINYPNTSSTTQINFSDNTIDLTNGGPGHNVIPYQVNFTVTGTGQPLSASDGISGNVSWTDMQYRFMDGLLGSYEMPINTDTIHVGIFDNTLQAEIFVRNPKINLTFKNSFGFNVYAKFDSLYGLTNKGERRDMTVAPITIDKPASAGGVATSNYTIDTTNNPQIQNLFNPAPNYVIYNGKIQINPGSTATTYSFITDTSTVSLSAEAELPAWFKIIKFELQDSVKLTLPADSSILQKAEFKMLMDNALPVYGTVQLYFADESYNVLDSLVPTTSDILGQAPVDGTGVVNGRTQAITKFEMDHNRYMAMAPKVRYAIIRGNLKTSGTGDVKILSSNNLIVKLAFRFKLNVSQTDL